MDGDDQSVTSAIIEPPAKRLRSSDTDLTIIVGEGAQQKTYACHRQIMAMHSQYIDTILATPMKEQLTMTLTFPEIHPCLWEQMLGYLQPGVDPPSSTYEILRVLPYYDKYEFMDGIRMCDRWLASRFEFRIEKLGSLAAYVSASGAAYKHNLPITKAKSQTFVREVFRKREARLGLTQDLIIDFVPVMQENETIWNKVSAMLGPIAGNPDKDTILANPFFPDLLLRAIVALDHEYNLDKKMAVLSVKNAGISGVNGQYQRIGPTSNFCKYITEADPVTCFVIKKLEPHPDSGGSAMWVLLKRTEGDDDLTLFTSSAHPLSSLPPRGGWLAIPGIRQNIPPILKFD
jgi:BTB/POZ domain